jgi:hypothetical protein
MAKQMGKRKEKKSDFMIGWDAIEKAGRKTAPKVLYQNPDKW